MRILYTTIGIKPETKEVLDKLKKKYNLKSYDDLILFLIDEVKK